MGINPLRGAGNLLGNALQDVEGDLSQAAQTVGQAVQRGVNQAVDGFDGAVQSVGNLTGQVASTLAAGIDTSMGPVGTPPVLQRPVVMITGLTMQASSYDPMAQHLASDPRNGAVAVYVVADGQFHEGSVKGPVMEADQLAQTKIFEVQYTDVKGAPSDKAPQIAQAMDAIQQATGSPDYDVVCHSAGCTDFRLYLDQRSADDQQNIGIAHAVFVGPASHGTEMGNLGAAVGQVAGLDKAGGQLAVGSSLVDGLNADWDRQRSQVKQGVTVVGLEGAPTASPQGLVDGDGYMPANSVAMPGTNTVMLQGIDPTPLMHLWEIHYSGVINTVDSVLGS